MFLAPSDAHESTPRPKLSEHESHRGARAPARMQRFTRQEDLADLEDMGVRDEALSTGRSTGVAVSSTGAGHDEEQQRERRYIDAHTSFLNSADAEGSGYIPDQTMPSMFARLHAHNHMHSEESAWHAQHARTPASSLTGEEESGTAPGSPHSFLSSSSIGYYSHVSRPSSQTGFWVDQEASSLNLIMPSSAMFVKSREPTAEGDRLGFVKMMVVGKSKMWQGRVVQDMFKWDGIIANDYEDEFLQERSPHTNSLAALDPSEYHRQSATCVSHSSQGSLSTQSSDQHDDASQEPRRERSERATGAITERYASSMVLPAWARTGLEDAEMEQEILVKNICFVETPGYGSFVNPARAMDLVASYLGRQFQTTNKFFTTSASNDDSLGRFLANNATGAHSHVDACLYIIEGQLTDQDIAFMRRLQPWVNLVPVLITKFSARMDVANARMELIRQLQANDIQTYGIKESEARVESTAPPSSISPLLGEDMLPPPLSLDEDPVQYDFTSPPFVFYPSGDPEDHAYQRHPEMDVQQLDVSEGSGLRRPALASQASSPPPASLGGILIPDLHSLRKWIYVDNMAALQHHTTLKFLRWRRHLPTIALSPLYSSQGSNSSVQHQQSDLVYPSAPDFISGSLKWALSATTSGTPASYSGPQHMSRQPLPTDLVGVLLAQERRRISIQAAKLLETHGQVFRRIVLERQEAWSVALAGMEREQRIDFLVQELKGWATDRQQKRDDHGLEGPLGLYSAGSQVGGLGQEVGIEPSLRDALDVSQDAASGNSRSRSRRGSDRHYSRSKHSGSVEKRSHLSKSRLDYEKNDDSEGGFDGADPLGLGHWIGHFFGAVGGGIYHIVVMIGMGSFATCVYTHLLENRVTWVG